MYICPLRLGMQLTLTYGARVCRDHVRTMYHAAPASTTHRPCTRTRYARTYHIRTWRRRHMLMLATGGVSEAKAMAGDVGAVSDVRHNRLRVSAASCMLGPNIESMYRI